MKKIIFLILIFFISFFVDCSKKQITPGGLMDTPEAHYAEGKRLLKLERYDDAFIEFQRAVALNKKFAPGYEGLGLVWIAKNDLKRAEENINKCIDLDDKFAPGLIAKGRLLIAKNDPQGSLKWFEKALKLDPKNEEAYIYNADAYVLLKKYDEAEKLYSLGMEQLPNSLELNARWEMMQAARRAAAGLPPQYLAIARSQAITRADLCALLVVELDLDKITKEPGPPQEKKFAPPPSTPIMGKQDEPKGMGLPEDIKMHWAKSFISKCLELGIIEPYPDGNFDPQRPITRADFAMAVQNLLKGLLKDPGLSTRFIGSSSPFPDVPSTHFAFNAVMLVTTRGIMKAKLDGTFGLMDKVSGTDALLIIKQVKGNL